MNKLIKIDKEKLKELYINQQLNNTQIAKILGISPWIIGNRLELFNIPIRKHALTPKISFSGKLEEKAYLLGLRAGDIYARKHFKCITVEVTSSKPEQIQMFQRVFSKYGKVSFYEKKGGFTEKTTRAYCYLNDSFNFLIEKSIFIPEWILKKEELFYSFLTGYVDSEGSWIITKHKRYKGKYKDVVFSLGSCDKIILEQIQKKLQELGFNSHLYLVRKMGTNTGMGVCHFDLYRVMIMRVKDVIRLAKILLPLTMHEKKRDKILKIIELEPLFKRTFSLEIKCPLCSYGKLWKYGFWKYKENKYPRYICSKCKRYFSEKQLEVIKVA